MLSNAKPTVAEADVIAHLDQLRGKIISNTGGWFPGRGVFSHGYSLLDELVGEKSYFQILVLNATGKLVERALADWLEAAFACLSWPDSRIWCNQIGALAGAARTSVVAATAMGSLAADSRIYGSYTTLAGMAFIQEALLLSKKGLTPEQIIDRLASVRDGKPFVVGYFRPIAKGDERIAAMERVGKQLGFARGEHLALAYEIEAVLRREHDETMNINGYASAFLADQGFSPQEVYQIVPMLVASGVTACYVDTRRRPADSFLPLRCEDIIYQGAASRPVP